MRIFPPALGFVRALLTRGWTLTDRFAREMRKRQKTDAVENASMSTEKKT